MISVPYVQTRRTACAILRSMSSAAFNALLASRCKLRNAVALALDERRHSGLFNTEYERSSVTTSGYRIRCAADLTGSSRVLIYQLLVNAQHGGGREDSGRQALPSPSARETRGLREFNRGFYELALGARPSSVFFEEPLLASLPGWQPKITEKGLINIRRLIY
jgi:hypothetical protein